MNIWYFETSAVNKLTEHLSTENALPTKLYQLIQEREWRISALVIWEILLTNNEYEREKLIYFCQHFFASELLPTPAELIISYINQGMPIVENRRLLTSKTENCSHG